MQSSHTLEKRWCKNGLFCLSLALVPTAFAIQLQKKCWCFIITTTHFKSTRDHVNVPPTAIVWDLRDAPCILVDGRRRSDLKRQTNTPSLIHQVTEAFLWDRNAVHAQLSETEKMRNLVTYKHFWSCHSTTFKYKRKRKTRLLYVLDFAYFRSLRKPPITHKCALLGPQTSELFKISNFLK